MRRTTTATVAGVMGLLLVAAVVANRAQPRHPPDSAPGRTARRQNFGGYLVQGRTITIAAPRAELYRLWRDVQNLPRFLEHIEAAEELPGGLAAWTLRGPGGTARVEARLVEDRPDEALAWRSTDASEVDFEAKVQLRDAPGGRGTEVEAHVAYRPPYGILGHWIAKAFRSDPLAQGRHDLKRLKMLMETGEIATAQNRRAA